MEKCYYFLYYKHNLTILLKVNDFTKLDSYKEENDTQISEWQSPIVSIHITIPICLFSEMAFLKQTKHFHY